MILEVWHEQHPLLTATEKQNQPRLCLLLNLLLSYSFRNTKLCCLPVIRKSKTPACKRMKGLKLSALPEHHWLPLCWRASAGKDFSLTAGYCAGYQDIPPSDRFCGSAALCNNSHAAGRGDILASLLLPGQPGGRKRSRNCLVAHAYPTAMAWLPLSEGK